jgi:hypothetical protein
VLDSNEFLSKSRRARINFHLNLIMFKAQRRVIELQLEKGMAVKTVDRTLLQGQSVDLFRAAIRSQAAPIIDR